MDVVGTQVMRRFRVDKAGPAAFDLQVPDLDVLAVAKLEECVVGPLWKIGIDRARGVSAADVRLQPSA